jgi:hypothetical protein
MVVLLAQVRALRSTSQSGLCNNVMYYVMRLQPTDLARGGRRVHGLQLPLSRMTVKTLQSTECWGQWFGCWIRSFGAPFLRTCALRL